MRYFARRPDGGPVTFSGLDEIRRSLDRGYVTKDWMAHQEGGTEWKKVGVWLGIEEEDPQRKEDPQRPPVIPPPQKPEAAVAPTFAGIMLLLAAAASLFMGGDPSNPSPFALVVVILGVIPAALSLSGSHAKALVFSLLFIAVTGFFALFACANARSSDSLVISLFLGGGLSCLLAVGAAFGLRGKRRA